MSKKISETVDYPNTCSIIDSCIGTAHEEIDNLDLSTTTIESLKTCVFDLFEECRTENANLRHQAERQLDEANEIIGELEDEQDELLDQLEEVKETNNNH